MSFPEDEFLIRKILLSHDPDGRRIDSHKLLQALQSVIRHATPEIMSQPSSQVCNPQIDVTSIWSTGGMKLDETVRTTLIEIQHEILHRCSKNQDLHTQAMFLILHRCSKNQDLHTQAMFLFEKLEHFGWDAKVALVFAAFGMSYGKFWLITQSETHNPLATLISAVNNSPNSSSLSRNQFKVLSLLINIMVEVSRTIIEFESLPLQQELIEYKALASVKSRICEAAYWIFRSCITCSSLIAGQKTIKLDQVNSRSRIIAAGTFSILVQKLNALSCDLKEQLPICCQQIETGLFEKLQNLFNETHVDNQEVLRALFALKDDFPFSGSSSQEKYGTQELKNKVVILLISKPELLPIEKILWLVQQIHDHPERRQLTEKYAVVWFPIASSSWSRTNEISFQFLSNSLPFFSVREPWLLNPAIYTYIKHQWNFQEKPVMVVLDVNGMVTNSNALDMVWIWGAKAFPFSIAKERKLWEQETSMLHLLIDGINPLLTYWVEEGKNVCIYASDNLDWIRQFNSVITEIRSAGIQLEVIYVGWRDPGESICNIVDIIHQENLSASLSFSKLCYFWLRMESFKNSISRLEKESACDGIVKEMSGLIEIVDNDKVFAIVGKGSPSDLLVLQGEKIRECFDLFPLWAENVTTMGLATAIINAIETPLPQRPFQQSNSVPYEDGVDDRILICCKCRRFMEKVIVYRCDVAE